MILRAINPAIGLLAVLLVAVALAANARAQDPFADPPAGGAPMPMGGEGDAFGGEAGDPAKAPPPAALTAREPLVIQQIRDSKPTTPAELMRATLATWQYGRPDESKRYLAILLAAKPAEADLAALESAYADFLVVIAAKRPLQPEGKQVSDAILAAAQNEVRNPDRINALIAQLSNESLGVRQDALRLLAQSGPHVVTPALRVLADSGREAEHRYIRAALAHLKTSTELPMLGALEIPNDYLKWQVIVVLGQMGSQKALMHLVRPAVDPTVPAEVHEAAIAALTKIIGPIPDRYEAERYLGQQTNRLLNDEIPYAVDQDNLVTLWYWDDAKREVLPRQLDRHDAAVMLAARVADDLYALKASDASAASAALHIKLLTNLELAKVLSGLNRPLPMEASTAGAAALAAGPQVVSQVLSDAIARGRIPAAIAAVEVLGQLGDSSVLYAAGDAPAPLAEALSHPDRRLRFMAALAAVKLAPGKPFPGASRVAEILGRAAATTGSSYVLVGHPRSADAQSLVAYMNGLGYEGEASYIGWTLAEEAFTNPDVEFVLIGDAIDLPPVLELVQWLRRDHRTAHLPIGVMAHNDQLDRFRFALRDDPYSSVFPRLHSTEVAATEVQKLLAIAGRNLVGRDERIEQAQAALAAFAVLAANDQNYDRYQLLRQEPAVIAALYNPALAAEAAGVLALLGSPASQTALVDFASQNTIELRARQTAALALAAAVQRRGLNLTQVQIAQQYDRYNASETLDKPTQELLGSILDTIEAPAAARGELSKAGL